MKQFFDLFIIKTNHVKDGQRIYNSKHPFYFLPVIFFGLIGVSIITNQGVFLLYILAIMEFCIYIIAIITKTMFMTQAYGMSSITIIKGKRVVVYSIFIILIGVIMVGVVGWNQINLITLFISLPLGIILSILYYKYSLDQI